MAIRGAAQKFAVVGPCISRKSNLQGNSQRRGHSWACDEACELNILETDKLAAALALIERCSDVKTLAGGLPTCATWMMQQDKSNACAFALGSEEYHSTVDGSGPEDVQSSAGDDAELGLTKGDDELSDEEGDFTVWPDTDSEDGFCSAWDTRRGSLSSEFESEGTTPPLSMEAADECCSFGDAATRDSASASPPPEPEWPRTPIKVRNGMAIDDALTTLMIRNLPASLLQDQLIMELDKAGFSGLYDFCHLPVLTASGTRKGYAFVNMIDTASAELLSAAWHKTRQTCLGMKPDDQALDIVAANVQGFEANVAMVSEPRKRRGGKGSRAARALAQKVRGRSSSRKPTCPKVSQKAPSVPPGTFHDTLTPAAAPATLSSPQQAAASGPGAQVDSGAAAAPPAEVPHQSKVLSILGLADTARGYIDGTSVSWNGPVGGSSVAMVTSTACDGKTCAGLTASPVVLSVAAPGSVASRSAPR